MRSHLTIVEPAADLSLAPIETLRVAAGLDATDASRDTELASLELRIAAEITDACAIAVGEGAEPTLRRELLRQTFRRADVEVLVLDRRHNVELASITIDGEPLDLDDIDVDPESGMLTRRRDGYPVRWRAVQIVVEYQAGFDEPLPPVLLGAVADVVRIRLSEGAHDPLDKAITIEIPDVETVRRDRWLGALPGASKSGGLPADIAARLGRFMNQWMG